MSREDIVISTLVAYKALLIGIGFWASKKTIDTDDFFLGGRQLGPLVAAVSYSSSASSAWTMLGLSGIAYVLGLSSIWFALGSISGMFVAWYWIAPRLMTQSRKKKAHHTNRLFVGWHKRDSSTYHAVDHLVDYCLLVYLLYCSAISRRW